MQPAQITERVQRVIAGVPQGTPADAIAVLDMRDLRAYPTSVGGEDVLVLTDGVTYVVIEPGLKGVSSEALRGAERCIEDLVKYVAAQWARRP